MRTIGYILLLLLAPRAYPQGNAGIAIVGWWRVTGGGNLYAAEDGTAHLEIDDAERDGRWINLGGLKYKFTYADGSSGVVTLSSNGGFLDGETSASRFTVGAARAPERLSNASIVELVGAGLNDDVILGLIQRHASAYSFTSHEVDALRESRVPPRIVAAMWKSRAGLAELSNAAIAEMIRDGLGEEIAAAAIGQFAGAYSLLPDDVAALRVAGVSDGLIAAIHVKLKVPLQPSAGVSRREGRPMATETIHWDSPVSGRVGGAHAPESVKIPQGCPHPGQICDMRIPTTEFLIHVASPAEAAQYQLVRLHAVQDHREFGAMDGIHLESHLIAEGTYLVSFSITTTAPSGMGPGDYGFLAPDGALYTFTLTE
jgi:hypothetical protein